MKAEEPRRYDFIVVGGGPAGLMCALSAREFCGGSMRVALLEKNAFCGKKLLLSGSGQCNVTAGGALESFFTRYGEHDRFVQPALREFSNVDLVRFLNSGGVQTEERPDGKIFPTSFLAAEVRDFLVRSAQAVGVDFFTETPVLDGERDDGGFLIRSSAGNFLAPMAAVAVGGRSFPRTGSTGDGYRWAKKFGHTLVAPRPALAAVVTQAAFPQCAGISLDSNRIELWRGSVRRAVFEGEILWTHTGLSGPAILNAARYFRSGDTLRVSLVRFSDGAVFDAELARNIAERPKAELRTALKEYGVADRLIRASLETLGMDGARKGADLRREERRRVADYFVAAPFVVRSLDGFDRAMATAGGVELSEVNRLTMESRIVSGLFFAGETLDIDGDTGGYNIQFALSSGRLAGRSAGKRFLE